MTTAIAMPGWTATMATGLPCCGRRLTLGLVMLLLVDAAPLRTSDAPVRLMATPAPSAIPATAPTPPAENPDDVPTIDTPARSATAGDDGDAGPDDPAVPAGSDDAPDAIPVPPAAPRVATGPDYDACLDRLSDDPAGALAFATGWAARDGGPGATHCRALAEVALGRTAEGAALLDRLADESAAAAAVRASVYAQAERAWMLAGDPERAAHSASAALALTPDDADELIDRAAAYAALRRYREAVSDLDQALDVEPSRIDAMVARAGDWRELNAFDHAEQDVDGALARDPQNADALLERGIIRQRLGDLTGAREDWEAASDLAPDDATGDLARQDLALLEAGPRR